jgi:phytoene dehydrogenase-like protein
MDDNTILIIGAGFAGLAAGIYAQMNGYQTQIFEMHTLPGGLCTAWKRKGYTIDGCIHWLVGSSPESPMHRYWEEVGIVQGRTFVDAPEYARYEGADGRTVILYADIDRLEAHLLALSPQDAAPIRDFIAGIRLCLAFESPAEDDPLGQKLRKGLKMAWLVATKGRAMQRWLTKAAADFAERFQDPLLRAVMREMWFPDFSMFFMLFTFAYLHDRNAGYPIGGSMPMSLAMAKRYVELGGVIHYGQRVEKVIVEDDRAVGIRLADGSERRASRVISAADGHATIFQMLEGRYVDDTIRARYETWPVFPPLLLVGVGVARTFDDVPLTVSGISFPLREPVRIGHTVRERLEARVLNQDPTMAPPDKTTLVVMLNDDYAYWRALANDREAYEAEKARVADAVVAALDQRWPGLAAQVEMVDVATPLTFERYTGNWQGSFEGWMLTPQNASTVMKPLAQTLPGLRRFTMCGQWVEPGGGLPTSVLSGRRLVRALCKEDGRPFEARV